LRLVRRRRGVWQEFDAGQQILEKLLVLGLEVNLGEMNFGAEVAGADIGMNVLLACFDPLEFRHDEFDPGDSVFDDRFLEIVPLEGALLGAGPPFIATLFRAGRK
jgi:hypothetical protein